MGIHVIRSGRGAAKVRIYLHPGEKLRPLRHPLGKSASLARRVPSTSTQTKSTGTTGDFGADFE